MRFICKDDFFFLLTSTSSAIYNSINVVSIYVVFFWNQQRRKLRDYCTQLRRMIFQEQIFETFATLFRYCVSSTSQKSFYRNRTICRRDNNFGRDIILLFTNPLLSFTLCLRSGLKAKYGEKTSAISIEQICGKTAILKKSVVRSADVKLQIPLLMYTINTHNMCSVNSQAVILTEELEQPIMYVH